MTTARVALISGVGDGIGRACALSLAAEGFDLVLGARGSERLARIADEVRALGRQVLDVPTDIADAAGVERLVSAGPKTFGRLDAVVNVAARSGKPTSIENLDAEEFRRSFEVNTLGTLEVSRRAVPFLRSTGGGAIVQISALSAHTRLAGLADYTSTKSAMVTASLTLAREVGKDNIRVNVVVPGYTTGQGLDRYLDSLAERRGLTRDDMDREILRTSALRRFVEPSDIAEAVAFLSTGRARAITGQVLHVNAGEWFP